MKCSECGSGDLDPVGETHSLNLYDHRDERYQCQECGRIRVYGLADDRELGFSFYVPDRQVWAPAPKCPDHSADDGSTTQFMVPTKYWESDDVVQFKCPICELISTRELRPLPESRRE